MPEIADYLQHVVRIPIRAVSQAIVHPGGELFFACFTVQVALLVGIRLVQRHRHTAVWPALFPRRALKRRSTIVDVGLFLFAYGLPLVGSIGLFLRPTSRAIRGVLPSPAVGSGLFASNRTISLVVATLATLVALDFGLFVSHWLHHKIPILWAFHAVHHSAPEMTPLTATRVHPVEYFVSRVIATATTGLLLGVWRAMVQPVLSVQTILGTHAVFFVFQLAFAAVRHSSVPMSFGPLERVFVSPRMHQLHHSVDPSHHDRNFGTVLSVWDALFGLRIRTTPPGGVRFGVLGMDGDSIRTTLISPFAVAAGSLPLIGTLLHSTRFMRPDFTANSTVAPQRNN